MRFAHVFSATLLLVASTATLAHAGRAVTYSGTLGKIPIVVELQEAAADGSFLGRYSYLKKGIDIPLHGTAGKKGWTIEEEKPCNAKLCQNASGETLEKAPIGADWSLKTKGETLSGTWKDRESGKSLEITLEKVSERNYSDNLTGMDTLDPNLSDATGVFPVYLGKADLPYDFLKWATDKKAGAVTAFEAGKFRHDTDPRTGLDSLVVTELAGADPKALNAWLDQEGLYRAIQAFSCQSRAYLGMGWFQPEDSEGANGYDGGVQLTVDHLSTRLMGLTEAGSFFCGGAHPNHFIDHSLVAVDTGQELLARDLVKGWVAKNYEGAIIDPATVENKDEIVWGPNDDLVAYVRSKRKKFDAQMETDCGYDDLVASNLGAHVKDGNLVFTLDDLPHAIFVCTEDLLAVPLKDAGDLLTEKGKTYLAAK